ncbi:MAG: TIM barrel protein [Candidatus Omnitrophica bacterium]|nr:TIM barrel protein [Candidatus Omnitrophota bacterium]MCM8828057.1 TIM barrel protein [Candidatus Omnitrophota bacterium]
MVKIDACIETVFPELKPEEKISKIKEIGYNCAEIWFPDNKNIDEIASALKIYGVRLNDLVVNSPDGSRGGFLVKESDIETYMNRLAYTIKIAKKMNCNMAITCTGNSVENLTKTRMIDNIIRTLSSATEILKENSFTLVLEPLNSFRDHKNYFLDSAKLAAEIIRNINSQNVRLLYDIYHMQIMEGNICDFIERNIDIIGHFHSAGVPGRHELYNGELNYQFIIKLIDRLGYKGCFGLEYMPAEKDHALSLRKTLDYLMS